MRVTRTVSRVRTQRQVVDYALQRHSPEHGSGVPPALRLLDHVVAEFA